VKYKIVVQALQKYTIIVPFVILILTALGRCSTRWVSGRIGDALSYPLCRIIELTEVFIPEQDGGILKRTGASWTCSIAPFVVAEFSISTPSAPPGLIHSNNTTK
jgi:hypothetical protein